MKNPALQATAMLVIGGLVFGLALWLDQGDDGDGVAPLAPDAPVADIIVKPTPIELKRQEKYEEAKAKLAEYEAIGENTGNGTIKVRDVDGKWYYVKDELVTGVGRYGEPIYGIAKYRRRGLQPLVERKHAQKESFKRLSPEQEKRWWRKAIGQRPSGEGVGHDAGMLPKGAVSGAGGNDDGRGSAGGGSPSSAGGPGAGNQDG